jgi:Flp pilus assembly protein TadG
MAGRAKSSKGQIAAILALILPVLLGVMSLSADVGVFYLNWLRLQKAADAAALAGAGYLPYDTATAITTADNYAMSNGMAASEIISTSVAGDDMSISITLRRVVPAYFARLLGLVGGPVTAQATAGLLPVSSVNSLVPIGIDSRTTYSPGQTVTLMEGQIGPGNWGPLALGGSGASTFEANVENGYVGKVSIGDLLNTETGVMAGPTRSAFNARLSAGQTADPSGTYENHTLTDARVATVPMVDFANINGKSQVPVIGFAELWLVSMDNKENITTYFIKQVADGQPGSGEGCGFGACQVVLIR